MGDWVQMGMSQNKRMYTLKIFFIKFIVALIIGAGVGVVLPLIISAFASNMGYITVANYNEIQAEETASILSAENDISSYKIPSGIKYLISDKEFSVTDTNMNSAEQEDALKYANGEYKSTATGKQFILVTRDKEYCILQYYVGSHFTNSWLDMNLPSPDIIITLGMIINCLIIFSILVLTFAQILKKELKPVMEATIKIDEQELEFQISTSKIKEFNDILNSICDMKNSLKESLKSQWNIERQQQEQITALAHDLKTPLTIVSGNADLLSETAVDHEQKEYISYILDSVKRMENYIGILIDLSKNTGNISLKREKIYIGVFIDNMIEQMHSVVMMKNINLSITVKDSYSCVYIDPILVERAIINVLSNAVDHSPIYGEIILDVREISGRCKISIIDSGPGFTSAALKYGLERFFMDDKSRNYQCHYGMGLYITNSIIKQHNGVVELKNEKGAEVDIYLPIEYD